MTTLPAMSEDEIDAIYCTDGLGPLLFARALLAARDAQWQAAVDAAVMQERKRMSDLYAVVGRCIELGHVINETRLHDYCGGEIGLSAESIDGGQDEQSN